MNTLVRIMRGGALLATAAALISCGGGDSPGSSTPAPGPVAAASNVVPVTVDSGPTPTSGSVNTLFTTVTLCVPGSTTQCQTIDHVQVDTASYGFRILAPVLSLALPLTAAADGNSLVECTQFVDGYSWGPVAVVDLQISGETASSVPIQVIGDPNFAAVPALCSGSGPAEDTVATFGANGILGVGVFQQDCGSGCESNANAGFYYSCTAAGVCTGTAVPVNNQVLNPVPLFVTDNNGTFIDLAAVSTPGATSAAGSLIFGIDTQANNKSGTQSVLTVDASTGNFTTLFNGQTLTDSFIDSGTNGLYFNDGSIPVCASTDFSNFYCPSSALGFSATLTGLNGVSVASSFTVDNAETLAGNNPTFAALPTLAGTFTSDANAFDWGLPFFYGRRVATAIEAHSTAVNTGPYIAF